MIRYRLFEIWRFVAALLIMLYHFGHFAPGDGLALKNELAPLRPLLDMFFIISGFLIFARYGEQVRDARSYGIYLYKRLIRLYPLHLATLSYFVLIGLLVSVGVLRTGGEPQLYDWSALPSNLLLIQAWGVEDRLSFNFVSWSLSAEWFAYLLLPVIIVAFRRAGLAALEQALPAGEAKVALEFLPRPVALETLRLEDGENLVVKKLNLGRVRQLRGRTPNAQSQATQSQNCFGAKLF